MKNLSVNSKKKQEEEEEDFEEEEEDEEEDDEEIELPPTILKRVEALRKLHGDVDTIDDQYKAERVLLEAKYEQKRQVLYEGRKNIVTGIVDVEENEKAGNFNKKNSFFIHKLFVTYFVPFCFLLCFYQSGRCRCRARYSELLAASLRKSSCHRGHHLRARYPCPGIFE